MKVKYENCGKHFVISPSHFYRSKHHFCSNKCFGKFYKVLNETQVQVLKKDKIKRGWAFKYGWKILTFYEDEIKNRLNNILCKVSNVLEEGNVTLITRED